MNRHLIRFTQPAADWNAALPIGNGFLGAMIYGGDHTEHLQVNEDSVWSGGPMDRTNPDMADHLTDIRTLLINGETEQAHRLAKLYTDSTSADMRHYEPLGDVRIAFDDPTLRTSLRTLDIDTAVATVTREGQGARVTEELFASNPDHVIVQRLSTDSPDRPISCTITASRVDRANPLIWRCDGVRKISDSAIELYGVNGGADGIGYHMMIRAVATDGIVRTIGSAIRVEHVSAITIYIAGRTTYRSDDPSAWCQTVIDQAAGVPYQTLKSRHIADYRSLYERSAITFDSSLADEQLNQLDTGQRLQRMRDGNRDVDLWETYLAYGRYLFISSSREGSLPANLQGIWNQDYEPAWGSKYTININAEMNYWFAEKTNLGNLHMPLINHIEAVRKRGRHVAELSYKARGFVVHHNTDIWGDAAVQDNYPAASVWPLGGAWLCLHIIEHYRYTHDQAFMRSHIDTVHECILFFLDTMIRDDDGYWAVGPSVSPEHEYLDDQGVLGSLCIGATMDNQILRHLFQEYLTIADELNVQHDDHELIHERLQGLRPPTVGADGRIMEWAKAYRDADPGHRHFSPLFGLYPGTEIRVDTTPELTQAAARFIERRMSNGSGASGWSRAWVTALYARLHDREHVGDCIHRLLTNSTLDNLLDNHPPFQIDGNFGAVSAMYEVLIQDYGDTVYLLAALPDYLSSGTVTGVILQAGAIIDMRWDDGTVRSLTIHARRNGTIRLRAAGMNETVTLVAGQTISLQPYDDNDTLHDTLERTLR